MENIIGHLQKIYRKVIYSIGFYPFLISAAFFFLACLSLYVEDFDLIAKFKKEVPHFIIQDRETARVILATLVGSILSLTVFSFTMVMVVLNQASSNFSPRLLPGLISDKGHQVILGVYIGTLTFCMIILISLGASGIDSNSFGLSTMIAAILSVLCVGLFVSFINSISKAIQIQNIIGGVADYTERRLARRTEQRSYDGNVKASQELKTNETGYFHGFDVTLLEESISDKSTFVELLVHKDQHLWENSPVLRYSGSLSEKEIKNLRKRIDLSKNPLEGESGIGGMVQLMEVAVKAMSPGVNDPGTAITVITKLGMLLNKALKIPERVYLTEKDCKIQVVGQTISSETLMRTIVQPIRLYSKKDVSVLSILIKALKFLESDTEIPSNRKVAVRNELKALEHDLSLNIENEMDKEYLLTLLNEH